MGFNSGFKGLKGTYSQSELSYLCNLEREGLFGVRNGVMQDTGTNGGIRIRGGADKSLARPGRKQATATKLGIYSTYSPRSSIHFLAHYSNFCKPLKNKIQNVARPTMSPRQQ